MIVTDLDRTLLRSDKTISAYTADILSRSREMGIMIVFATARYFRTVEEWLVPALGFQPDIVISSNGAYAYSHDKVWYQSLLEASVSNEIISAIHERGGGQITVGTARLRLSERVVEATHAPFSEMSDFRTPISDYVHYVDFRGGNNIAKDITQLFPQVRLQGYIDSLTTFIHKDARKGLALESILTQLHIAQTEVIGFGDDVSDLDFLQVCGTKVAVSNAVNEALSYCNFICDSCDNDGVAHWIEENLL
jgi:HAD superfamily hydrolase (TIGR01484 family)